MQFLQEMVTSRSQSTKHYKNTKSSSSWQHFVTWFLVLHSWTFNGTPHMKCKVLTEMLSNKKANTILFLGVVTCVAWPCCCSCCSCCAVRKLTGLFPAMSFVPAGIVVRMIFLPNPLMLQKENCGKVSEQQAGSFTLTNCSSVARRLKLLS